MPRTPLATVADNTGRSWRVYSVRDTSQGFPLLLGYPEDVTPGYGGGGRSSVILTPELAAYLERHRSDPQAIDLPLGTKAVTKLRSLLGHHRYRDAARFYEERVEDLSDLTGAEFAEKHGVTEERASYWRIRLLGQRHRPPNWWREPEAAEVLKSDLSHAEMAERLGVSMGTVRRLRWVLLACPPDVNSSGR